MCVHSPGDASTHPGAGRRERGQLCPPVSCQGHSPEVPGPSPPDQHGAPRGFEKHGRDAGTPLRCLIKHLAHQPPGVPSGSPQVETLAALPGRPSAKWVMPLTSCPDTGLCVTEPWQPTSRRVPRAASSSEHVPRDPGAALPPARSAPPRSGPPTRCKRPKQEASQHLSPLLPCNSTGDPGGQARATEPGRCTKQSQTCERSDAGRGCREPPQIRRLLKSVHPSGGRARGPGFRREPGTPGTIGPAASSGQGYGRETAGQEGRRAISQASHGVPVPSERLGERAAGLCRRTVTQEAAQPAGVLGRDRGAGHRAGQSPQWEGTATLLRVCLSPAQLEGSAGRALPPEHRDSGVTACPPGSR